MTDGERLVWASTFSLLFERSGDAVVASHAAARAIDQLRATQQKLVVGKITISNVEEREFLDEIVNAP